MVKKRVAGRFVRDESADGEREPSEVKAKKAPMAAPRPKYCRTYTRKRVAEALPDIVEKFVEEAKKGSVAHAKALANLGGLDKGDVVPKVTKRRGKGVAGLLLEALKREPGK